jgi:hypothetical protein
MHDSICRWFSCCICGLGLYRLLVKKILNKTSTIYMLDYHLLEFVGDLLFCNQINYVRSNLLATASTVVMKYLIRNWQKILLKKMIVIQG